MNNRIIRIGLAAVAVAAIVVIGIVLLKGTDTGAQLSPSSSLAQAPGLTSPSASVKAGGLDTSFGGDGKVVTNLTRRGNLARALAIQADGKIVLAGDGIARYNRAGTLDTTFGVDGRVMTGFSSGNASATGVAIQADGRIVVVGTTGSGKFALARYNSDGTLDTSFGVKGELMTGFTSGSDSASGVAIQADGRIVVVGWTGVQTGPGPYDTKFALARYDDDGTLDATFGDGGKVMTDFTAWGDEAKGVAIQADGKIVVVGMGGDGLVRVIDSTRPRGARWEPLDAKFALARYNDDGTLDASFGANGKMMTDFTAWVDGATGMAIQADGKIVAAGVAADSTRHSRFALARYNSDGTLDASFGASGKVMTYVNARGSAATGVAIQADGRIVVAGVTADWGPGSKFALARYNGDGTLDATFGVSGKVETNFTPTEDGALGVAIQADGRIVVAGMANGWRSKMKFALARYLAAAVESAPTASAVAGSPSPGQSATASGFGDGVYLVGTDIPAGLYKGTTVSDTFSDWQLSSDANGSSIIASDPATSGQFYVQVKQGQYLKLSGVQIVNAAAAAPTKMRSSVGDGVYLVGTDIPAGRYRAEATFDEGNWKISSDANGTLGVHSADGLFVSSRGRRKPPFYIQVKKGQYLELFSVKVRRVK